MAADSFEKSAEHHRRAADARERGDEAEADRLTEEASRFAGSVSAGVGERISSERRRRPAR
jgi:hypothetical protein